MQLLDRYNLRLLLNYFDLLRCKFPPIRRWYINLFAKSQQRAARALQGKTVINVAFQLTNSSSWKNDYLFSAMVQSRRYHPYIVIMPPTYFRHNDQKSIDATIDATECYVKKKGYEYILPYDRQHHRWLDFRRKMKPDIMFFSVPYKDTPPRYYIYRFRHTLTCLIPYGFSSLNLLKLNYGLIFHGLVGMFMVETTIHKQTAASVAFNKAVNCVVTGYPGIEVFMHKDYVPQMLWKPQETNKRRVIWAPHHTIDGGADISTFLRYYDDMLVLAERYADKVQFVFKPHPVLQMKLHKLWGEERTKEYYQRWQSLSNAQLEEGPYVDIFLTSDALIHDCGSFTAEYLYVGKPCMYLVSDGDMEAKFSTFGKMAFAQYYKGRSLVDIENFIEQVVIAGDDPMAEQRHQFYKDYLYSDKMPSERILAAIEDMINKD